jgi:ABC-type bacteriocin/lantibiotic exporter with double-glycine peptidase domain
VRWLPLLCLLLLAAGCSPFRTAAGDPLPAGVRAIADVPFRPQAQRDDCGPAALASLLAHRGRDIPVAQIRAALAADRLGGTLAPDLENFARQEGFATRSGRGDAALLRAQIDAGRPVLIPIQAGNRFVSRPHYLVVYGYDPQRFLVHAGVRGSVFMPATDLVARWKKMSRLYLYLE